MINYSKDIKSCLTALFPITRSITGDGNRQTLQILNKIAPLNIIEYPTGQNIYDWTIPKEWNIKDAWIKNSKGEKIIDFKNSNLHIISYSTAIHKKIKLNDLKKNLHYLKSLPEAIPYRTNYYKETWGFCLSFNDYLKYFQNENEEFEIFIDSDLSNGSLSVGEILIEGKRKKEYLISCYICHPSMANDSLSGVVTTIFLAKELLKIQSQLEHSYRIIFVPETIGAIAYCANNEKEMKLINQGIVITTCGGNGKFGYKQSWDNTNIINDMVKDVFYENDIDFITYPFDIRGSDERQYSTQAFRINTITITKDKYYEYPYYHTSLDNLSFVSADNINLSFNLYFKLIQKMDKNLLYKNLQHYCEVMLSKHDLYPKTGGAYLPNSKLSEIDIIIWSLFYLDGKIDLYSLNKKLNLNFDTLYKIIKKIESKGLIEKVTGE